jgi:hypothetical protein
MSPSPEDSYYSAGPDDSNEPISYLRYLTAAAHELRSHYVSLIVLIGLSLAAGVAIIAMDMPEYTAVATLGAAPSPLSDLTSMTSGLSDVLGSGITRQLGLGRRAGGQSDTFDQYVELLKSNRVAERLAQDPNVMHAIFYTRYDWERHRWKSSGSIRSVVKKWVKGVLHYSDNPVPGVDDVVKYLTANVTVDAPLTSSFVTVSLISESPEKARWLLSTLLFDADSIIREDKRRDVAARISYLDDTLPAVTQTEQREVLSTILSDQQQTMMMVRADERYASAVVDPPYASPMPTEPRIMNVLGIMFLLAIVCWGFLIKFPPNISVFARFMPMRSSWLEAGDAHLDRAERGIALNHGHAGKRGAG